MATHNATSEDHVVLLGCGDVGPGREPVEGFSELVKPTLATGDIRFAQVERTYSERGKQQPHREGRHTRVSPKLASVFSDCGFDVVSVASNHALDWGEDALLDTIDTLQGLGIQTIGAGSNAEQARRPAIFDVRGTKVGILGYCSVVREGYAAGPDKPGVAPMRAHTYYEAQEYQAGTPPRVITVPYEEDLKALCDDIEKTKQSVDVVVVSLHWGVHYIPRLLADYQRAVMKAVIDRGAALILGHHAHIPKGIEVYNDRVCFYSLSNFIMTSESVGNASKYEIKFDPSYPRYPSQPYGVDGKKSLIIRAELSKSGPERVSFLPVQIDMELRPEVLHHDDPRFAEIVEFMNWSSEGLPHQFTVDGDEVLVG